MKEWVSLVYQNTPNDNPTVYIRLRKHVRLQPTHPVLLGHVAEFIVAPEWEEPLRSLELLQPDRNEQFVLIEMLAIVRTIRTRYPELLIEYYGEPHVLVEWTKDEKIRSRKLLFPLVLLLLFIGSGLTIMNFHADVSMLEVHQKMYKLITGKEDPHPLILQIPYSLGLGAGMLIFFNRVFKKKLNEEPDPLEVEMFLYQENVRNFMVAEEYLKLNESRKDEQR